MKVECPRCHKVWQVHEGQTEVDCNCHLYCEDGDKPADCSVATQSFDGQLGWPRHLRTGLSLQATGDNELDQVRYCSTHDKYIYKVPITIPCDWRQWYSRRAKPRYRMSIGKI